MAEFRIKGPDGSTYRVTAPEGATEQDVASMLQQQTGGGQQHQNYQGWGEYLTDLARVAGQGAALGFGDEITAGVRSAVTDTTYDEALAQERAGIERFRDKNPGVALATELAAGIAVPGLGAGRAVAQAGTTLGRAAVGAKYGAGFGTVGGFGVGEGDFGQRAETAVEGLKWGAGIGAGLPTAAAALRPAVTIPTNAMSRAVRTVRDDEEAARLYFADRLRQAGATEVDVARDLQRGQRTRQFNSRSVAELPEAIADTMPATQRMLRGIKVGGDADDIVIPALESRQAGSIDFARGAESGGQYQRVYDDLRRALDVSTTPLKTDIEKISSRRALAANQNFTAARAASEPFDLGATLTAYSLEAQNLRHPAQRAKLVEAIRLFDQRGNIPNFSQMGQSAAQQKATSFGVTNVDRFQSAKEALDDLIVSQVVREQPNLKRLLTRMKHDLMNDVAGGDRTRPIKNAKYFEALQDYASRSELLEAVDVGRKLARETESITPAEWKQFSRAEQKIIRKAYLSTLRGSAGRKTQGPSTDYTGVLRTPNVQENLRVMLPPRAGQSADFPGGTRERLAELATREQRTTKTNQMVLGNSTTAEKAVDAIDVGRMARVARYIRENGGPIQAAITAVSDQLEQFGAIKGRRARYLARKLLSTNPAEQAEFLMAVRRTYGASRAARLEDNISRVLDAVAVGTPGTAATIARYGVEDGTR